MADEYIKRNDLINYFFRPYSHEELYSNIDIDRVIKSFPSEDVAPVKRSFWEYDSDMLPKCAFCEEVAPQRITLHFGTREYYSQFVLTPYCPECGAIMEVNTNG